MNLSRTLLLAALVATPALAQIQGIADINTSQKSNNDSECASAVNPANPNQVFVLCNTDSGGLFAARSIDGGNSWIYPDPADKTIADGDAGQGPSACCDPTLAWDSFGNLFIVYLNGPVSNVPVVLSTDGGATFSNLATLGSGPDQPTVSAASGQVWVVWNQGSMRASGANVTGLGAIGGFSAPITLPGTSSCTFGDVGIGPDGSVAQVCQDNNGGEAPTNIRFSRDPDGTGPTAWGTTTIATATNLGSFDVIPAQNNRTIDAEAGLGFDFDPTSPTFGRIYLAYGDETADENDDVDVRVRWSDDDGATWSAFVRANDDATTRSQFLQRIAVDPTNGDVGICWHDSRNSPSNTSTEYVCALSTADPPSFAPNAITGDGVSTSNGQGVEYGDYQGLSFYGGDMHPVWADISNSTGDNPNGTSRFDCYVDVVTKVVPVELIDFHVE